MHWQMIAIAYHDPYLAGSMAARAWDWWSETTAEEEADSAGFTGERRAKFLQGWQDEIAKQEQERKQQFVKEYDEMARGADKGDPAVRC